ncbi:hypothetical protein niasHS_011170 [Heterodera schachtii]|uniref:Uncharacterized protein n=1 Tax=Heterodera schachtii TaxID=97005 RepID=A0ABD2IUT4_HETSC
MRIANSPEPKSPANFDARAVNARRDSLIFLNDWTSLSVICFGVSSERRRTESTEPPAQIENRSLFSSTASPLPLMSAFPPACNPSHARAIGERVRAKMGNMPQTDEGAKRHAQTTTNFETPMEAKETSSSFAFFRPSDCPPSADCPSLKPSVGQLSVSWPPAGVSARNALADAFRGILPASVAAAVAPVRTPTAN